MATGSLIFSQRRILILVGMICLIGLTVLWWGSTPRFSDFEKLISERQYDQAEEHVNSILKSNPNDSTAYYLLSRLELAQDRPDPSMNAMRKALELGYPEEPLQVLRAVIMSRAGQLLEAEPILTQAFIRSESPKAEIAEGLSRIFLGKMQLAEASKTIEAWMKAAPLDDRPYLWRNEIDERIGADVEVIIQNYRNAIKRNPGNLKARIALADLLMKANRTDEAKIEFTEYRVKDPENVAAILGLGQIALTQGDTESAEGLFKTVLEKDGNQITALGELAQIEIQKGEIEQACNHLKKATELSPFDSEVFYKYAQALKLAGNTALAKQASEQSGKLKEDQDKIQELRKAIVQRPEDLDLRVEAAQWLIDHGHEKEGLEWVDLVLKQKPGHQALCRFLVEFYKKKQNFGLSNYYQSLLPK